MNLLPSISLLLGLLLTSFHPHAIAAPTSNLLIPSTQTNPTLSDFLNATALSSFDNPTFTILSKYTINPDSLAPGSTSKEPYHYVCDFGWLPNSYRPARALYGHYAGREACVVWFLDNACATTHGWGGREYAVIEHALEEQVTKDGRGLVSRAERWTAAWEFGTWAVQCRSCFPDFWGNCVLSSLLGKTTLTGVEAHEYGVGVGNDKIRIYSDMAPAPAELRCK